MSPLLKERTWSGNLDTCDFGALKGALIGTPYNERETLVFSSLCEICSIGQVLQKPVCQDQEADKKFREEAFDIVQDISLDNV